MKIVHGRADGAVTEARGATFTGTVWGDPVLPTTDGTTINSVTFTPGARTFWHHHERGQILVVTAGDVVGAAPMELLVAATPARGRSFFLLVIIIVLAFRPGAEALGWRVPGGRGRFIFLLLFFFFVVIFILAVRPHTGALLQRELGGGEGLGLRYYSFFLLIIGGEGVHLGMRLVLVLFRREWGEEV